MVVRGFPNLRGNQMETFIGNLRVYAVVFGPLTRPRKRIVIWSGVFSGTHDDAKRLLVDFAKRNPALADHHELHAEIVPHSTHVSL